MPSVIRGSDLFDTNTAIGFSTNHNAATGTVTIPSGLAIGTRRLIRKIHPTQGQVEIFCTGETFTSGNKPSIGLNANGDFWLLEKVTDTRWDIIAGHNKGNNGDGAWSYQADGILINRTHRSYSDIAGTLVLSVGFIAAYNTGDTFYETSITIDSTQHTWVRIRNRTNTGFLLDISEIDSATTGGIVLVRTSGRWF